MGPGSQNTVQSRKSAPPRARASHLRNTLLVHAVSQGCGCWHSLSLGARVDQCAGAACSTGVTGQHGGGCCVTGIVEHGWVPAQLARQLTPPQQPLTRVACMPGNADPAGSAAPGPPVMATPAEVHFAGYQPGQTQRQVLRLRNTAARAVRVQILPPEPPFQVRGRLPPPPQTPGQAPPPPPPPALARAPTNPLTTPLTIQQPRQQQWSQRQRRAGCPNPPPPPPPPVASPDPPPPRGARAACRFSGSAPPAAWCPACRRRW